jgi:pimeloyl-ACP methyl ester carboxylesterase
MTDAELKRERMSGMQGEAFDRIWLDLQNDMASWSSRSTHRVLNDAGHFVQLDRPDAVVAAVREVVDSARSEGAR